MYYVKFFDSKNTTSGWVECTQVTPFDPIIIKKQTIPFSCKMIKNQGSKSGLQTLQYRLRKAIEWAEYCSGEDWNDEERLEYFQDRKK